LEEAINTIAEHHHNLGNVKAVRDLQGSIGGLTAYVDDEEAVLETAKLFNNPEWRKAMLPAFKKFQDGWIKMQGNFRELS